MAFPAQCISKSDVSNGSGGPTRSTWRGSRPRNRKWPFRSRVRWGTDWGRGARPCPPKEMPFIPGHSVDTVTSNTHGYPCRDSAADPEWVAKTVRDLAVCHRTCSRVIEAALRPDASLSAPTADLFCCRFELLALAKKLPLAHNNWLGRTRYGL